MKIAIIGAGFTGLAAGLTLAEQNHEVTIIEKDTKPGGLAIGFSDPAWEWTLEKHYHHWFTNDQSVLNLAKKINYPVEIVRPKTSVFLKNGIFQLDSPYHVLTFAKLSLIERIRMAGVIAALRYNPVWQPLEKFYAHETLKKAMGEKAYSLLWEPQLKNKFGKYYKEISLAWFWARLHKRTSSLAYPKKGFLPFAEKLSQEITQKKGTIHYETETISIKENPDKTITIATRRKNKPETHVYDAVIVTLATQLFCKLTPSLPDSYKEKYKSLQSLGAINVVLRLRKPFLPDHTYWLSVCDTSAPVMAVVEHTNFMNKKFYNNEHLVYVGNYLPSDHEYFSYTPEQLHTVYQPFLEKLHPGYEKELLKVHMFTAPFAQPIVPLNYSRLLPPLTTPFKNVFLANMQQVYPWDRGTNYAVELGEKVASLIHES